MASRYEDIPKPSSAERIKRLETESEIVDNELEKQMKVKPYPYAVATWECYRFGTGEVINITTTKILMKKALLK